MQKRIIVAIAGTEGKEFLNVAVEPNARAIDIINKLELKGFALASPKGGMFAMGDNIYDAVTDGQKLYATPTDVQAGE